MVEGLLCRYADPLSWKSSRVMKIGNPDLGGERRGTRSYPKGRK